MRRFLIPLLLSGLMLVAVFGLIQRASGQGQAGSAGYQVLKSETQGENVREVSAPVDAQAPNVPDIGFIDSPTASCYQPDPSVDACYINWYYASVNASPNYMVAMTMTINAIGPVARFQGFFQTSMYVPYSMQDRGIKVPCGALGAGGIATMGNSYAWTIKAIDSSQLKSANYGSVYCPAFVP